MRFHSRGGQSRGRDTASHTILYIGDIPPIDSVASQVVLFRHLSSLERNGFKIIVVTGKDACARSSLPPTWHFVPIPLRRPYFPPFRPNAALRFLRWILLDIEIAPIFADTSICCIVSILTGEYLSLYAERVSRRIGVPLFYFYHDRTEHLHYSRDERSALRIENQNISAVQASQTLKVWTVSTALIYCGRGIEEKFRVVYPFPAPLSPRHPMEWTPERSMSPTLVHIGTVYDETMHEFRVLLALLRRHHGRLLLFSHYNSTAQALADEYPDVAEFCGFAASLDQIVDRAGGKSTSFLVVYPDDVSKMPWVRESFPSKLVQCVQTGLPVLVFAPAETAVAKWCVQSNWTLHYAAISEDSYRHAWDLLRSEFGWSQMAAQSRFAANNDFSPQIIENLVIRDIRSLALLESNMLAEEVET